MPAPTLACAYATPEAFLTAWEAELMKGGVLVRGAALGGLAAMSACELSVQLAGWPPVLVAARVAAVVPGVGVAVMFGEAPPALKALVEQARAGGPPPQAEEEMAPPPGALTDRLRAMTVQQKMSLALSGQRDERTALFRDPNKVLHVFVLKNPRIGLDEVQAAAKLPGLSPDALKMIAEHREWSGSPGVLTALVRNPRTPLPIALQLVERLPPGELRTLAKGGAREQVVHAARRKVNG